MNSLLTTNQASDAPAPARPESEAHLHQTAEKKVSEGHALTNERGIILEVNRSLAKLVNVPHAYLIGKSLAVFVARDERRTFRAKLAAAKSAQDALIWEMQLIPRYHPPIPVEVYLRPIQMKGKTHGLRWVIQALNSQKQSEDMLRLERQRLQALSHRVVEAQEAERRKLARELHDEVGQLLTGLKLSLYGIRLNNSDLTQLRPPVKMSS
jgi:PAS domain S-box-containing protein